MDAQGYSARFSNDFLVILTRHAHHGEATLRVCLASRANEHGLVLYLLGMFFDGFCKVLKRNACHWKITLRTLLVGLELVG